ncbi:hypothetical protein F4824DRAFT_23297 [Ustulina deusta]|nr:hypothetical protein F4824DRAFT_23297 [Ustulina deusta]
MAPSPDDYRKMAEEAERKLNTYESKTGAHRTSPSDEEGVDTRVINPFPGGQVRHDQVMSTNGSARRSSPKDEADVDTVAVNQLPGGQVRYEEGGDLDARDRQTRGEHFEGVGGPEHKRGQRPREYGGSNEFDSTNTRRHEVGSRSTADETSTAYSREVMTEGRQAAQSNIESAKSVPHKGQYPGAEYHAPREVPGDMSAEGYEAPSSVTEASRESARYNE